jgi:hypothetical protein
MNSFLCMYFVSCGVDEGIAELNAVSGQYCVQLRPTRPHDLVG